MSKRTQTFSLSTAVFVLLLLILLPVLVNLTQAVTRLITRAAGKPANIAIDTQKTIGAISNPWLTFSQGGEGPHLIEAAADTIKRLSPRAIRLDHVFDHYNLVGRDTNGQLTLDFSDLDRDVKAITAVGALPFFSLSYMPPALSDNGTVTGKPRDWNEWAYITQLFIEHYSGKNNLNLTDVYYEVWNEPDLFGSWKLQGDKNYLTLYEFTSRGAQAAQNVNQFKLGGPATTQPYKNWILGLTEHVRNKSLRLDFISWHRYDKNPKQYAQDALDVTRWLFYKTEFVGLPKVVSEWGYTSELDSAYDTNVSAAHTLAVARETLAGYDMLMGFELVDGKNQHDAPLWGRWGLLTHPSVGGNPKPRYFAYQLLAQLNGSRLLVEGEGTWVRAIATYTNETIKLLVTNYDSDERNIETVPIRFFNLKKDAYQIRRTGLDGKTITQTLAATNQQLTLDILLPSNGAYLIELTPFESPFLGN